MTEKELALSRKALRSDQILELHFDKLPEPPPEMLKLPGMAAWINQLKLMRERDVQAFHRMLSNINSTP